MIKNLAFSFLIANLIAAAVLLIVNLFGGVQYGMAIAVLAVTAYLTYFIIVKQEKQTGVIGVAIAVGLLILTITFLSIILSIIESLNLRSIWDSFVDTFSGNIVQIVLAIAAVAIAVVLPLRK